MKRPVDFNAPSYLICNKEWLVGILRRHHLRVGYGEPLTDELYQTTSFIRIVLDRLNINLQQFSYLKSVLVLLRNCQQSLLLVTMLTTVAVCNSWYLLITVTL